MIKLLWSLLATARIRVTGLKPERVINAAAQAGISLKNVVRTDIPSLEADVGRTGLRRLRRLLAKEPYRLTVLNVRGALFRAERAKHRQVLYIGLALCLCALIVLSNHTWVIRLHGSTDESLITLAKEQGMLDWRFLARSRAEACGQAIVKHDQNILWSEVDVHGTVVDLYVKEAINRVPEQEPSGPVIATKDGVIRNLIVFRGVPQVKNGDPVKKGQVLILPDETGMASGKAVADVWYCVGEAVPKEKTVAVPTGREETFLRVQLFGLVFQNGESVGLTEAETEKTVPTHGLPVSVSRVTVRGMRQETRTVSREEARTVTEQNLINRLFMEIPAGIGGEMIKTTVTEEDDAWIVTVYAETAENVAGRE